MKNAQVIIMNNAIEAQIAEMENPEDRQCLWKNIK